MAVTLSLVFMFALLALAVPFWVVLGVGTVALLLTTDALPLSLLGEALFDNVDSFALIAIPLFILTGDVMVRIKARLQAARFRGSDHRQSALGARHLDGHGLRLFCVYLRFGCGRRGGDRPHHHETAGRTRLSAAVRVRAGGGGRVHRHPDSAVDRLHYHRSCSESPGDVVSRVRSHITVLGRHAHECA
jgi:hypothetical protein